MEQILSHFNHHQVPIGLEEDGKIYEFETLNELVDKLQNLSKLGYQIPDDVYEEISRLHPQPSPQTV